MNINILNEFNLIFYKNLIKIIFNYIYINYTYKITLIRVFLLILSFKKKLKHFYEFARSYYNFILPRLFKKKLENSKRPAIAFPNYKAMTVKSHPLFGY